MANSLVFVGSPGLWDNLHCQKLLWVNPGTCSGISPKVLGLPQNLWDFPNVLGFPQLLWDLPNVLGFPQVF